MPAIVVKVARRVATQFDSDCLICGAGAGELCVDGPDGQTVLDHWGRPDEVTRVTTTTTLPTSGPRGVAA